VELGRVEQHEDPRERGAQLVGDRRSEARAQLVERRFVAPGRKRLVVIHRIVTTPLPGQNRPSIYRKGVSKILIVEDDNVIADGMSRHLSAAGFDPIVVGRGEPALHASASRTRRVRVNRCSPS
jgi:hypothetical protein